MLKKLSLGEHIRLHQPLPWNVLNDRGTLLLRKGFVPTNERQIEALVERGAYVDEATFNRHRDNLPPPPPVQRVPTLFEHWDNVFARLGGLLRRYQGETQFASKLVRLSQDVIALIERSDDVALFTMSRLDTNSYSVAHPLQVAVFGDIYGRFMNWDAADRLTLVQAALTMNISIFDLQLALSRQSEPLSQQQRAEIWAHPMASRECLEALGVTDPVWLNLVAQHHETSDGKGYPLGLAAVAPAAEVLNIIDRYIATMSWRYDRDAKQANVAARELYVATAGETQAVVARVIKAFGLYPPGTFVRLANSEIAVVTGRTEHANKPRVATLIGATGNKLQEPVRRDTSHPDFAISKSVPNQDCPVYLDTAKLFNGS